ncbi:MAG TPA: VOC family protein [Bacillota bacterium]|nr:VOC family protein [Bacillota bacterium]
MNDLHPIIGDYGAFLQDILERVARADFDPGDFSQLDHLCYRTSSLDNYQQKKQQLGTVGELLGETPVNGRPIAVFRLHQPILFKTWRIDAVELPAPKPGQETSEGLQHIEFVLYDSKEAFLAKHTGKQFDLSAAERGINPEIAYRFDDGLGVKFHLLSLTTVLYLQNKLGITEVRNEPPGTPV